MNNYTKTMWVDHLVENPDRYNIIYNPDNSITLSPLEGEVFQEGTPINAIHLNKIEEGVYQSLTGEILLGEFQGESRKLVLKKGTEETMPTLSEGELGYATDTRKLFMGTSAGNASVMPDIDVSGDVEEVIDRRVNHVKNKSLSQIVIEEMQTIKDFFVSKITERINNISNKPLNQVIREDSENLIKTRLNSDLNKTLDILIKEVSKSSGSQIFLENGFFAVPQKINFIKITAIAAGGYGYNGGAAIEASKRSGNGGSGGNRGQFVRSAVFAVVPGDVIPIIVGKGNTIIGNFITLIAGGGGGGGTGGSGVAGSDIRQAYIGGSGGGGSGGIYSTIHEPANGENGQNGSISGYPAYGKRGGDGGGFGAGLGSLGGGFTHSQSTSMGSTGENSLYGGAKGGVSNVSGGGGAGGGFGAGGGGGGGAGCTEYSGNSACPGGAGAQGIVIIEW